MEIALKIAQFLIPLIIDAVRAAHPDKTDDEHKQIVRAILDQHVDKPDAAQ